MILYVIMGILNAGIAGSSEGIVVIGRRMGFVHSPGTDSEPAKSNPGVTHDEHINWRMSTQSTFYPLSLSTYMPQSDPTRPNRSYRQYVGL